MGENSTIMVESLGARMNAVGLLLPPCRALLLFLERSGLGVSNLINEASAANPAEVEHLVRSLKADCSAQNLHSSLPSGDDARCAAASLVALLSELPEPLIPVEYYRRLAAAMELPDKEYQLSAIKAVLMRVPTVHFELLKHVAYFLSLMVSTRRWNKVQYAQLVETFAPFMSPPPETPDEVGLRMQITDLLITDFSTLFAESELTRREFSKPSEEQQAMLWRPQSVTCCSLAERKQKVESVRKHVLTTETADAKHFPAGNMQQLRGVREWMSDSSHDGSSTIAQARSTINDILNLL